MGDNSVHKKNFAASNQPQSTPKNPNTFKTVKTLKCRLRCATFGIVARTLRRPLEERKKRKQSKQLKQK